MSRPTSSTPMQARGVNGRAALAAWTAALAVGWLIILPWLSGLPAQKANIDWLREQRIDPSARYYTEVEAMEPILQRIDARLTGRHSPADQ